MRILFWFLILYYGAAQFSHYLSTGGFYSGRHFDTVDFANYWVAAKIYFEGSVTDLFSPTLFMEHLRAAFQPDYPGHGWSYPPHYLFFCLPLYFFDFHTAFVLFIAATFLVFLAGAWLFVDEFAPAAPEGSSVWKSGLFLTLVAPAAVVNLSVAQNGFLISGLLLLGLALMRRRGLLAGICFGLLTIKPHLGLLIPLLLLIDRNWAAFVAAAVTTVLLVAASALVFGADTWTAYLTETAAFQVRVMTDIGRADVYPLMMLSAFVGARLLGLGDTAAWVVHAAFAVPAVAMAAWIFVKEETPQIRAVALVIATFIVAPYSFNYDAGALGVACALLAATARRQMQGTDGAEDAAGRLLTAARFRLACAAASLPLTSFFAMQIGIPIAPVVLISLLVACSPLGIRIARWWADTRQAGGRENRLAGRVFGDGAVSLDRRPVHVDPVTDGIDLTQTAPRASAN